MFEALLYIIASCIEGVAFFIITFGLFRINLSEYIKELIVTILVVSLGTFLLSEHQVAAQFIPLINLTILIIFLIFFFKVSLPHTILIMVSGYIACMVIQWGLIKFSEMATGINLVDIKSSIGLRTTFQFLSSALIIAISVILRKSKLWFTFVPYSTSLSFKMSRNNIIILTTATTILFIFGNTLKYSSTIFGFSIWLISLISLLIISIRREFQID
ncbi:hypothetical protein [Paenibacillus lautus]|uniref:hypothetical protein n=1 Tax=Paenibacillus lautus TaxID=1401 RepID=UPI001C7DF18B|nr:hypothetical protein [Paenibacillus lautus]MBX4152243.1 hypothetical protein [Paenibacillus lautus]